MRFVSIPIAYFVFVYLAFIVEAAWSAFLIEYVVFQVLGFLGANSDDLTWEHLIPGSGSRPRPDVPGQRVFGTPGSHIAAGPFGATQSQLGEKGEKEIGRILNTWAQKYPEARVFHGVRFSPGKNTGDVDHIVLVGDRLILIDAKWWAYGNYTWAHNGEILRDGQSFPGGNVHMLNALNLWRAYLPSLKMSTVIALAQPDSGRYTVTETGKPSTSITLTTGRDLTRLLDDAAAKASGPTSDKLVTRIRNQMF